MRTTIGSLLAVIAFGGCGETTATVELGEGDESSELLARLAIPGPTGLNDVTPQEIAELMRHQVKRVKPTVLALERLNNERAQRGESPLDLSTAAAPGETTAG